MADGNNGGDILVSNEGAPAGTVYVHDQSSGATVLAPADNYTETIKEINNR